MTFINAKRNDNDRFDDDQDRLANVVIFHLLQIERTQTKGKNWYFMPAPEMTEEKKNDLLAIQMRGGLYADKFFKRGSDTKGLPKYFQVNRSFLYFFINRLICADGNCFG